MLDFFLSLELTHHIHQITNQLLSEPSVFKYFGLNDNLNSNITIIHMEEVYHQRSDK